MGRDTCPCRPHLAFEVSPVRGQTRPSPRGWLLGDCPGQCAPSPPLPTPPTPCPVSRRPVPSAATCYHAVGHASETHVFRPLWEGPAGHTVRSGPRSLCQVDMAQGCSLSRLVLSGQTGAHPCSPQAGCSLTAAQARTRGWVTFLCLPALAPAKQSAAFSAGGGQELDSLRSCP